MSVSIIGGEAHRIAAAAHYVETIPEYASNTGIIVGNDVTVVVDSRLTPDLGANLRAAIDECGSNRIVLVNTHFHGDHWFGNAAFADSTIIASEYARTKLAGTWADQVTLFQEIRPHQTDDFAAVEPVLPNIGIVAETKLDLGGTTVTLLPLVPAHTPGDVVIIADQDKAIYCGDVVTNQHWPVLWDAHLPGWLDALDQLAALEPESVVPGHGPAGDASLLPQMKRCLRFLCHLSTVDEHQWADEIDHSEFRDWLHREKRVGPGIEKIRERLDKKQIHAFALAATA